MKIIDKYILGLFLKIFSAVLLALLTLFTVIAFFDNVDDFIKYKATLPQVTAYLFFRLPEALLHMAPMAVLIASILTFSLMSRSREVMVMMSCGFSALRISAPVLSAALAVSFLLMLNVEYLMPASWKESSRIFREDIRNIKSASADRRNFIWLKTSKGKIWNIALLDTDTGTLNGVTVIEFLPGWRGFASITTAAKAYRNNGEWVFLDGARRTFPRDGGFEEDVFSKRSFAFDMDFEELEQVQRKPQEMSLKEINAHIKRVREAGYDDTRYVVDMYSKILFPLATVVMAFIAVPFGLKPHRTEGVLMGIAVAVFIGFLFWFIFSMGLSLGYSGKLPPALAAGGAHLLFLLAGSYIMISSRYPRAGFFSSFLPSFLPSFLRTGRTGRTSGKAGD